MPSSKTQAAGKQKKVSKQHYDIVISGAGAAGCLAAFGIANCTEHSVLLLEAQTQTNARPAGFDARVLALGDESLKILQKLGLNLELIEHANIESIHVSDRGHMGQVRLHANEQQLSALGKVVALDSLGEHLLEKVRSLSSQIDYRCPLKIRSRQASAKANYLVLSDNSQITCDLLLICDGGQSKTADLVGFQKYTSDYYQTAIISNIKTQLPHGNMAFERFTSQGPIAFLPMSVANDKDNGHYMSIVWCVEQDQAKRRLQARKQDFLKELQALFGNKLGNLVDCTTPYCFDLSLVEARPFVSHRAICIANAAQTLHPIAGQGFNLGIRDIDQLISVLSQHAELGSFAQIRQYQECRKQDKSQTIGLTDALLRVFSNQHVPLTIGRNLALMAMNHSRFFKKQFANFAMGRRH